MTENDLINKFLFDVHNSKGGYQFNPDPMEPLDRFNTTNIAYKMSELRLLKKLPRGDRLVVLTEKGEDIIDQGGWIKYLAKEKLKKDRVDRKEKYEYWMSKWKVYTFWISLFLGALGGVYSIIKIISSF